MGPGQGTSAEGPEQGSTEGCTVLPAPFIPFAHFIIAPPCPSHPHSWGLFSLLAACQPGGEMYFSDVYANQRLSETMRKHRVLWGA